MKDAPLLWLLAGPNGAGKSTFYEYHLKPEFPELPFVNADELAARHWPQDAMARAYDASQLTMEWRQTLMDARRSFVTETVFSHPSKLELISQAQSLRYRVILVLIYVEVEVAVARVAYRVRVDKGHDVPEQKIRERHARLRSLLAQAIAKADRTEIFYNGDIGGIGHRRIGVVEAQQVNWKVLPVPAWAQQLADAAGVASSRS